MIARLTGAIVARSADGCVIEVGGVGYEVSVPLTVLASLPDDGRTAVVEVVTLTREDGVHLYGFSTSEEKQAFRQLLNVQGVGPKIALAVLSGLRVEELSQAIAGQDWRRLAAIQGIGRKTAERILFDLKDKLDIGVSPVSARPTGASSVIEDVRSALLNLGYKPAHADKAVEVVRRTEGAADRGFEELLKEALRVLRG